MIVIGGGMAGLLAAGMLRGDCSAVLEAKSSLPDNHSAVLRFKTSIVGDTLNIPFKKVKALKAVAAWKNPVADAMAYSKKTNGSFSLRSIISANGELVDRFIAPENFPAKMAEALQCKVEFNRKVDGADFIGRHDAVISTLPMPALMTMLQWNGPKPEFESIAGINISADILHCNMYCSLYVPNPMLGPYRISINGNKLIVEVALHGHPDLFNELRDVPQYLHEALTLLGISSHQIDQMSIRCTQQKYQKILPIDEKIRKAFIMWASEKHGVYSLGRFATWRPGLLLDDVVNDVRVIQKIIKDGNYEHKVI